MKCAEVRKFVRLYLDSELDAKQSFEVQQHLELCAECAGLFEAEKKFDQRLGRFLRSADAAPALWKKIEAQIAPAPLAKFKAFGRSHWLPRSSSLRASPFSRDREISILRRRSRNATALTSIKSPRLSSAGRCQKKLRSNSAADSTLKHLPTGLPSGRSLPAARGCAMSKACRLR